jgi:type I restriction enzyme S subunit
MQSNYKRIGDYIKEVKQKNVTLEATLLLGININKFFMPSVANVIGTDMSNYRIVKKNQFACNRMHVGRDYRIPVALSNREEPFMVSPAYDVFEIIDTSVLLPEYLMMWFSRKEFDRNAWFYTDADVRGGLHWKAFCDMQLPIPSTEKQHEIVREYHVIQNRILLNNQLIFKLEETAQAIYKQWFVDFEFPNENGFPYKSNGGEMVWCEELEKEIPFGWRNGKLRDLAIIIMGQSPTTESYNTDGNGMVFYQGRTEFGYRFPAIKNFTSEPKRKAKSGDILMSVRAPVGDLNIANQDCSIGRGVASLKSKIKCNSFLFYSIQSIKQQFDVSNGEGTIYGSITKDGLNDIQVIKPNDNIVLVYEKITKELDKNIENYSKQNNMLFQTKDLILSKMATIEN